MKNLFIVLLLLPCHLLAQYEGAKDLPLPDQFEGMTNDLKIFSTPSPNRSEFADGFGSDIVWKHSTSIEATFNMQIVEVGAYLLNNGTWWKRASFLEKEIKELFATETLALSKGQTITYEKNYRYDKYTQTGINFWYVIALDEEGNQHFGYDILETRGAMKDGTLVLPLVPEDTTLTWTGSGSGKESEYKLNGLMSAKSGRLIIRKRQILGGDIVLDAASIAAPDQNLQAHLLSPDFFNAGKFKELLFVIDSVQKLGEQQFELYGKLTLLGKTNPEKVTATLSDNAKTFDVTFKTTVNRVNYGMVYASSTEENEENRRVADELHLEGTISFKKDYPGSMPWNNLKTKE